MQHPPLTRSSLRLQRSILLAIIMVMGALLVAFSLMDLRQLRRDEKEKLITQANLVSANIELHISSAHYVLQETLALVDLTDTDQHHDRMQSLVNAMPMIRGLGMLDRDGWHLAGTRRVREDERYFGDRPYFRNIQSDPQRHRLYISTPFKSLNGETTIALSTAILDEHNQFAGVIFAVLDADYIEKLMGSTLYTPDMWAALMHVESNTALHVGAHTGNDGEPPISGAEITESLPRLVDEGKGSFVRDLEEDDQLVAASTISAYAGNLDRPLMIVTGRSYDEAMATWHRLILLQAGIFLIFGVAASGGLLFYQHRRLQFDARRIADERRMLAREHDYRVIVEHTADCVVKLDTDGRYSYVNPAFCGAFGFADQPSGGGSFFGLVVPEDQQNAHDNINAILSQPAKKRFQIRCLSPRGTRYMEWTFCSVASESDTAFSVIGVGRDVTDHIEVADALRTRAQRDSLTGLANRGHFLEVANAEIDRSHRYGKPLSLLMIDLDHFKKVNDTWGHLGGDLALQQCAHVLNQQCRDADLPARIGGEEFALLLPDTSVDAAAHIAERLRVAISQHAIRLDDGREFHLTASVGVASLLPGEALDKIMLRTDTALYAAKQAGRNRVEVAAHHSVNA